MESPGIKEEPLIEFDDIKVDPLGDTESRLGADDMLELDDDVQNPQFYATILMKDEESEEYYDDKSNVLADCESNLMIEGAQDCSVDRSINSVEFDPLKRIYNCPLCSKKYLRKDHLNYHMKIHAGFKDFKCDVCNKEFRQRVHLRNHKKVHTGERDYKCQVCGKDFVLKHHLTTHNIKIHTCNMEVVSGAKRFYKCQICTKEFLRKDHFLYHTKIHTGLRDFKCNVCGKEFRQKTHLKNHMKLHTGEREFKCVICGKEFALKHHLTTHNDRIHRSVPEGSIEDGRELFCRICNKEFITKKFLNMHMKVHTG